MTTVDGGAPSSFGTPSGVEFVNGRAGSVTLTASDLGAEAAGTAAALVDDLSGVTNPAAARTKLSVYSTSEVDALVTSGGSLAYQPLLSRASWAAQGTGWLGLPGVRLRGGNLYVLESGGNWDDLYTQWPWDTYIKPQIDHMADIGGNAVRLQGDIRCVYSGHITVETYCAQWTQLIDYCASRGVYVMACLVGATYVTPYTVADITEFATNIAPTFNKPNVVSIDLYQEADVEFDVGTGGTWESFLIPAVAAAQPIFRAACPNVPITVSSGRLANAQWCAWLTEHVDFWECHSYPWTGVITNTTLDAIAATGKPWALGEFGARPIYDLENTAPYWTADAWYRHYRQMLATRPECMGALAWSIYGAEATDPQAMSLWGYPSDTESTIVTDELRRFPKRSGVPYVLSMTPTGDVTVPATDAYNVVAADVTFTLGVPCTVDVTASADVEIVTAGNTYTVIATIDDTDMPALPQAQATIGGPARRETVSFSYSTEVAAGSHTYRFRVTHPTGSAADGVVRSGAGTVAQFKFTAVE